MRQSVFGDFHGQPAVGLYSVRKGDVVDLEPRDVLRYLKNGLCELPAERHIHIPGMRRIPPENPNASAIAELEKQVRAEEAKSPKPAERTTARTWGGNAFVYPTE